jgi:hypothetical protein
VGRKLDGGSWDCGKTNCGKTNCGKTNCGKTNCGKTNCGKTNCGKTNCGLQRLIRGAGDPLRGLFGGFPSWVIADAVGDYVFVRLRDADGVGVDDPAAALVFDARVEGDDGAVISGRHW